MKPVLADDKASVRLKIEGSLSTSEVESLIADLALVRGRMIPEVTRKNPLLDPGEPNISIQDDPDFQLRLLRDGSIRLWIRNRGLGWLIFNIPVNNACTMRDYLIANTPTDENGPDFFSDEDPGRGRSH